MKSVVSRFMLLDATLAVVGSVGAARANNGPACPVTHAGLRQALQQADKQDTTGFDNHFWAVVVDRDGKVCAVAYSGGGRGAAWLQSRQLAAAKAFTALGFSLDGEPFSSGQLYALVQPGATPNPLYGVAAGNPVDAAAAYAGSFADFGTVGDPMRGKRIGGSIPYGGGLGLYNGTTLIGGVGLDGDTACADHSTAWRLRKLLGQVPTAGNDRISLDDALDEYGEHPHCPNDAGTQGVD